MQKFHVNSSNKIDGFQFTEMLFKEIFQDVSVYLLNYQVADPNIINQTAITAQQLEILTFYPSWLHMRDMSTNFS